MTNTKQDNIDWLLKFGYFDSPEKVEEALRLIKSGDDNEPYLSNRLIRIIWLTSVTTTASPDSETTLEAEKNVTDGDERSSDD